MSNMCLFNIPSFTTLSICVNVFNFRVYAVEKSFCCFAWSLQKLVCFLFKYVEEDEFVDAIKTLSSVKKEHAVFIDTQL